MIGLSYADNKHQYIHKMPLVGPAHNSPGYGETINCNRDRNNGRSTAMSALIRELTGEPSVLPVMLTGLI